jgi:3-oxoacyl-[acyl-carrier-protein] synthase II
MVLRAPGTRHPALALLRGAGAASDAESMTAPDTSGTAVRMAVERSLAEAGVGAADIAVINAHASATPLNDLTEREAFRVLFAGMEGPVVFGTKGNFGHSLGATGALEAVALILALRHGVVPPVVGLEQPDPAFPLRLPRGAPVQFAGRVGMSLTLGFGGFDTSLVLEGLP